MYDGNPPEGYITPEDYWDSEDGCDRTCAVADTGNYGFSMWSWCGQQSDNSEETTQRYLDTMAEFEIEYPNMRFIYMTGHTDGTGETGNLNLRNDQVRDYCIANNKVLFDFADIESYDPDGNYYLDKATDDECYYWVEGTQYNWAMDWCNDHADSDLCEGDNTCIACGCAHSVYLNCNLKGRAFWWMMARLAGWAGPPAPDLDGDGDVDLDDFAVFADCLAGPGVITPPTGCTSEQFGQTDLDHDNDVDVADLAIFQAASTGSQ